MDTFGKIRNQKPGATPVQNNSNEWDFVAKGTAGQFYKETSTGIPTWASLASTDMSDFTEAAQDAVGSILTDTTTINFTYNDGAGTITADVQGLTSANISDFNEAAQDAVGNIIGSSTYITVTYNDGANTISVALNAATRAIPFTTHFNGTYSGAAALFPDETATTRYRVIIPVPDTWDGTSDITVKTVWFAGAGATGNADIETQILRFTETDEDTITTVQAFTDSNLSWTTAQRTKILTTTIAAANIAANYIFAVEFQRNTGDANTGNIFIQGVKVRTGVY